MSGDQYGVQMDAMEAVLEEVALEGLDGITISAFWLRLQIRVPLFPLSLDSPTKQFIWQSLVCHPELEFYLLPKERRPLVLSDRYEGNECDPAVLSVKRGSFTEDLYPVHVISQNKKGIQGSCQFFKERILITHQVRTQAHTYEDAIARWGEKLVIVGSQILRSRALIGWDGDPSLQLPDCSYCILEKVGRSRWQGELQKDLQGSFKVDAGKIHYLRRVLDSNGLITMQSHVIKLSNGSQQHSLLLLLKRFHIDRRNKYDMLTEKVSAILSECKNRMDTLLNLREELCLPERVFKRLNHYMAGTGVVKILSVPLHEMHPLAGPSKTKKGTDIMVRCMKLIKESKRNLDDSGDEEDEDTRAPVLPVDIIYEKDMLTQTYELIENRGTKGISQSEIRIAMNVGKLEARMLCRLLERYMLIKGFMEDEGRQRTTKFISHVFVEESDLRRQFLKEKAKSEKLSMPNFVQSQTVGGDSAISHQENQFLGESYILTENGDVLNSGKTFGKMDTNWTVSQHSASTLTSTPKAKSKIDTRQSLSKDTYKAPVLLENDCSRDSFHLGPYSKFSADEEDDDDVSVMEEILDKDVEQKISKLSSKKRTSERCHETYRLLKRRNIIVEAVKNLRLVESLFTLQKMIMEQEKEEGVSTRCCKKSILRLVQKLSREGLVRLYRTTVVQDGITKKVEFVVHPSVNPNDPLVKSAIEQIRFRMSNSATSNRARSPQEPSTYGKQESHDQIKDRTKEKSQRQSCNLQNSDKVQKKHDLMGVAPFSSYHPVTVPGLGRTLGYLPKMPRLKVIHIFLWYIVHGHPFHEESQQEMSDNKSSPSNTAETGQEKLLPRMLSDSEITKSCFESHPGNSEKYLSDLASDELNCPVYMDDSTWMRHVPPATVHSEFGPGWVLVSDILLCLPLSVFVQIVQVSYKVENLEDFLNHPIKKHTLIRHLPRSIRQQLLYKRRYVFSVFQSLQKLSCMGLVQFGPIEKFQDKDQVFVYVKKKATIIDTTSCDPHYNLAQGNHPFDKRHYHLKTIQDVENFWFDLQFVCLNTPLGVVRCTNLKKTKSQTHDESLLRQNAGTEPEDGQNLERKCGILESIEGSRDVVDDGAIPGDGLGAGGLDSSFYSHLKRNWIWISYIINKARKDTSVHDNGFTLRLQTFLNKQTLPLGPGGNERSVFGNINLTENSEFVQIVKEATAHRSKRVCGGKNQKRKRPSKDVGKKLKIKKKKSETCEQEKARKNRYHDEADQSALQRMTRLRVAWTSQEDGLLMLCRIASNILNKKVKRPFVPWQVVRDIMHSSLEESLDKTSHSIGRRARYIIKNPQTYLNYKVCLAEVYQDKHMIVEFMTRKQNYDDLKVCAAEFMEFVERLKQKFSTNLGRPASDLPDTVHQLFESYRVLAVGDESSQETRIEMLNSVDDIHILVLQNLILSTLALSDMQMKSCRSLQTFRMYRKYSDDILVKAFLEFQKKRLVNRRRGNHMMGPKKKRALPFVPMSFQLSQTYYRLFTWRFPSTICSESYHFLNTLKTCGIAEKADVFTFSDHAYEPVDDMIMFPLDGPGGQCVTILSLLLLGLTSVNVKIPDQIVVVDSNLVENEVIKSLGKECLDEEDYDDDYVDEPLGNKRKIEVKARQASHTNYLLMRGYCAPGIVNTRNLNPNDNVVVNSCQVWVKLRNIPVPGRLRGSGSLIDFTAGAPCLPDHFTGLLNTKNLSINTFLSRCIDCYKYSPSDVSCVVEIHSAIKVSSFFGIKVSDLAKRFFKLENFEFGRRRDLHQYIQDLITERQVLKVGGATVRLVAMMHAAPWVLHSDCLKEHTLQTKLNFDKTACRNSNQPENNACTKSPETSTVPKDWSPGDMGETLETLHERESDCCFLGRPWRIVDGSLNKPVCKGMLEAVLYHIMTKPGITETSLLKHYSGVLQPVVVLELLQVLEHIGCIMRYHVEKPLKVSLFSCFVIPQQIGKPKLSEELSTYYEPSIDCTIRLGGIFPSEVNWNKWVL